MFVISTRCAIVFRNTAPSNDIIYVGISQLQRRVIDDCVSINNKNNDNNFNFSHLRLYPLRTFQKRERINKSRN